MFEAPPPPELTLSFALASHKLGKNEKVTYTAYRPTRSRAQCDECVCVLHEAGGKGLWLAASIVFARVVPTDKPYPCMCAAPGGCERRRQDLDRCPCWGRVDDLRHLPGRCCAVRAAARARLSRKDRDGN